MHGECTDFSFSPLGTEWGAYKRLVHNLCNICKFENKELDKFCFSGIQIYHHFVQVTSLQLK